jgi:hypothetical protein
MDTPRVILNEYIKQLPALKAEQEFIMIEAISYPHIKESDQRETTTRLQNILNHYEEDYRQGKAKIGKEEFAARAAEFPFPIEFVSKPEEGATEES